MRVFAFCAFALEHPNCTQTHTHIQRISKLKQRNRVSDRTTATTKKKETQPNEAKCKRRPLAHFCLLFRCVCIKLQQIIDSQSGVFSLSLSPCGSFNVCQFVFIPVKKYVKNMAWRKCFKREYVNNIASLDDADILEWQKMAINKEKEKKKQKNKTHVDKAENPDGKECDGFE